MRGSIACLDCAADGAAGRSAKSASIMVVRRRWVATQRISAGASVCGRTVTYLYGPQQSRPA